MTSLRAVLGRRLAAHHLTGEPLPDVPDAVGTSLGVQSQDPPLARFSLGLRTGLSDADVLHQLATGQVIRTHVLRATWHWVLAADLRWLLALTAPRIESGFGARHRNLGLTPESVDAAFATLADELGGGIHLSRRDLHPLLPVTGFPQQGQVVGHLLLVAELRGLICSGTPSDDGEHTYALLDELVPPGAPLDRDDAVTRLVDRFLAGHGPSSVKDLRRWCTVTATETTRALTAGQASGAYESAEVSGVRLWWQAGAPDLGTVGAWLLPTFDEVWLSHDRPRFERRDGHPSGEQHLNAAEAGGGVVVVDGRDVGRFRRKVQRGRLRVELFLASGATRQEAAGAARAAQRLGDHLGLEAEVEPQSARP